MEEPLGLWYLLSLPWMFNVKPFEGIQLLSVSHASVTRLLDCYARVSVCSSNCSHRDCCFGPEARLQLSP